MSKRKTQLIPIKKEGVIFEAGGTVSESETPEPQNFPLKKDAVLDILSGTATSPPIVLMGNKFEFKKYEIRDSKNINIVGRDLIKTKKEKTSFSKKIKKFIIKLVCKILGIDIAYDLLETIVND